MEDKLRLLAEKLVKDGLEEAEAERTKMLATAQAEAQGIIAAAQSAAAQIRAEAEEAAASLRVQVQSELQQLVRRAKEGLRADLRHLIRAKVLAQPIAEAVAQDMPNLLREIVQHLYRDTHGRLTIRLPEESSATLREQLLAAVHDLLQSTPVLDTDARIGRGFSIQREGEQYTIDFTPADFEAVLLQLLSDDLQQLFRDVN